jgi:transcriptional regulator with XRE-family HTH domain
VKKEIGYRIRKIRESKDLSQENMGADLGITAGAYAKIERGETDPSITRLFNIAEILEVDLMSFFQDLQNPVNAEDPNVNYGAASKKEVESLSQAIAKLAIEFEKLKEEINPQKKPLLKPVKKRE